jgi:4-hydroxythreonine-4-phosphate dehydrogenase
MTPEINQPEDRVTLGITHGDINGISYEIIIKAFQDQRIFDLFTPIVYGHSKVAAYYRNSVNMPDFNFNIIKSADKAHQKKPNLINISEGEVRIEMGQPSSSAGQLAVESLEMAVRDLKHGRIDAIVTAPINKNSIQSDKFRFPGHTEFFAEKFDSGDVLMLMVSDRLRMGVATAHIPLKEVSSKLTPNLLESKLRIYHEGLMRDFGIRKPRIAVLGLNPHAGEEGLLGSEENDVIIPVINKLMDEGKLVYGPFPADGFFGSDAYTRYDGILAMYHDQGLIPFKSMSFSNGVNYTMGLPVIRTSPAHGTAFEITGKNMASPESLREAMYLAVDIFRNRKLFEEVNKDPLPYNMIEEENNQTRHTEENHEDAIQGSDSQ